MKPKNSEPGQYGTPRPSKAEKATENLTEKSRYTHPNPTSVAALRGVATLTPKQVAVFTEIRNEA